MKQIKAKEVKEVDLAIQSLLSSLVSGILSVHEASLLSHLKDRKENLLAHQILNRNLKPEWIGLMKGMPILNFSTPMLLLGKTIKLYRGFRTISVI